MEYSQQGLELTESFEGCELVAYLDTAGVATIGYGHTAGVALGMTCTQQQAQQWLEQDIQWAVSVVNGAVKTEVQQGEFDAMVDFVFNLGSGNFDSSTLLQLVNKGNFTDAAAQFPRWDIAGGDVCAGLLRRRMAEQAEFNGESQ